MALVAEKYGDQQNHAHPEFCEGLHWSPARATVRNIVRNKITKRRWNDIDLPRFSLHLTRGKFNSPEICEFDPRKGWFTERKEVNYDLQEGRNSEWKTLCTYQQLTKQILLSRESRLDGCSMVRWFDGSMAGECRWRRSLRSIGSRR